MYRALIALSFASTTLVSCKSKEDKFAAAEAQLQLYQRDVVPKRTALNQSPPSWLTTPSGCPTEVMPERFLEPGFNLRDCTGNNIDQCLAMCKDSIASACYGAALVLQAENPTGDKKLSTPLFARACQLGDASGCTNWGSALDATDPNNQDCLRETYRATCERGQDPWGCTMYSYMIASQATVDATLVTINSYVGTSCRYGEDDPACQTMRDLLKQSKAMAEALRDGGTP